MRYRRDHPERFVLAHYIGSTAASSDLGLMLHRIMSEISERYKITSKSIPSDIKDLIQQFPEWLAEAGARGGVTLVLDALNQVRRALQYLVIALELTPFKNQFHKTSWIQGTTRTTCNGFPTTFPKVLSSFAVLCLDAVWMSSLNEDGKRTRSSL
jgi:hypothetical protein